MSNRWVALLCLSALSANASGFYFGENGAKAWLQGGAFTAQADDLTAIQHNPAGLAQLSGVSFLIDGQAMFHSTSFLRFDPGSDSSQTLAVEVTNQAGAFVVPQAAVGWGHQFGVHAFTGALGVYGPPAVGRYQYPEPVYPNFALNEPYTRIPTKYAPQRYELIAEDILVVYPTLSAAYAFDQKLFVGASLQLVLSSFNLSQAVYSGLTTPDSYLSEDPEFDTVVKVSMAGRIGVTGIFGVLYKPTPKLSFGASLRPQIPIVAQGKLNLDGAAQRLAVVAGDNAELRLTFPLEFRLGARFKPIDRLGLNADFVYQGWQSVNELVLTPLDVTTAIAGGPPTLVTPIHIPKHWHQSLSGRLGGSFDFGQYVTAHLGVMYESQTSPDEFVTIDFLHFDRVFITGGASVHFGAFDLLAGIAYTPTVYKTIDNSEVRQAQTFPQIQGSIVGDGDYSSGGFSLIFGLRGQFGKAPDPVTPAPEPAPSAPPAS